jgi:hypothetical protein
MTLEGTVTNGVVVLDPGTYFPNGARVRVELALDEMDEIEPPPESDLIAALRESLEDEKAGRFRPARDVLKEIALRHNLPLEPGE